MLKLRFGFIAALLFCAVQTAFGQTVLLNSFENAPNLANATFTGATGSLMTGLGVTNGSSALLVQFTPNFSWPAVRLNSVTGQNWSSYGGIEIDVTNPTSSSQTASFSLYSTATAVSGTSVGGSPVIPANSTTTVLLAFVPDANPETYGLERLPTGTAYPLVELAYHPGSGFNLATVYTVKFGVASKSVSGQSLIFDNLRLVPVTSEASLAGLIDYFGQDSQYNWPNKTMSTAQMQEEAVEEATQLAASAPPVAAQDQWGGWTGGPTLPSTGFFRTAMYNGKWWFVDPQGRLYFSMGVNTVDYSDTSSATMITGRSQMFSSLPATTDPASQFYDTTNDVFVGPVSSGTTYNFYCENLFHKFGTNWQADWQTETLERLKAWGFNTLANWSSATLVAQNKMPYVDFVNIGGHYNTVSTGADLWGPMADPFDPLFAEAAYNTIAPLVARNKANPWCLGFFVDNELTWYNISATNGNYALCTGALAEDTSTSPAKRAFIGQLQTKYGTVANFDAAWGTSFTAWTGMNAPFIVPTPTNAAITTDESAFLLSFARKYFSTVASTIKMMDRNHLYLGCRIGVPAWATYSPLNLPTELIQAASQYCDVVSFNYYSQSIQPSQWPFLTTMGKPVIMSEFSFGATDAGKFLAGEIDAHSQAARATDYTLYVNSAITNPAVIGCHWFRYVDDPTTGITLTGENANNGLLDVADTPYPDMVQAVEATNATIYSTRFSP